MLSSCIMLLNRVTKDYNCAVAYKHIHLLNRCQPGKVEPLRPIQWVAQRVSVTCSHPLALLYLCNALVTQNQSLLPPGHRTGRARSPGLFAIIHASLWAPPAFRQDRVAVFWMYTHTHMHARSQTHIHTYSDSLELCNCNTTPGAICVCSMWFTVQCSPCGLYPPTSPPPHSHTHSSPPSCLLTLFVEAAYSKLQEMWKAWLFLAFYVFTWHKATIAQPPRGPTTEHTLLQSPVCSDTANQWWINQCTRSILKKQWQTDQSRKSPENCKLTHLFQPGKMLVEI